MNSWFSRYEPGRPHVIGYLVAVAAPAAAVGIGMLRGGQSVGVLLTASVMLAAWFGGPWPSLIATGLSLVALDYFFQLPRDNIAVTSLNELLNLISFLIAALVISGLSLKLRQERQAAENAKSATERASQDAEKQRTWLEAVLTKGPTGICLVEGPNHVITLVSESIARMTSRSVEEVTGRTVVEAFPELQEQGLIDRLKQVYATGEPFTQREVAILLDRKQDGNLQEGFFNVVCQPMRNANHEVEAVLFHGIDVTDQVLARRELAAILDGVPDAVVALDREDRVVFANNIAATMMGYDSPDNLIGRDIAEARSSYQVFDEGGQEVAGVEFPASGRRGTAPDDRLVRVVTRSTGQERWVLNKARPIHDVNGRISMVISVGEDVTDLRLMDRQKDEFLAAAAHDLKTPLTAIQGLTSLVERRLRKQASGDNQRTFDDLESIARSTAKMTALVRELLDVSRLQMGSGLTLWFAPTDLLALAHHVVETQQRATNRHVFVIECAVESLVGEWDAVRMERVLENLVGNAVKFSPQGGVIRISLKEDGDDRVELVVEDNGIGIPTGDLQHIFEKFHRAGNAGRIAGTGIGLGYSRWMVEQHGGHLEIKSQEGTGTSVHVYLQRHRPIDEQSSGEGGIARASAPGGWSMESGATSSASEATPR